MGGYNSSSSSSVAGSPEATPPRPSSSSNSLLWGDSASFERVEHEQQQQQPLSPLPRDHTQIPTQSFVGLGRSLSLSASSVLSSVTNSASSLLHTSVPAMTPEEGEELTESVIKHMVEDEEEEEEDDFEQIRREDAFPPPPSFSTWVAPKVESALTSLFTPKGVLSAVVVYLAMYWRLKGSFHEGQARKWEVRFREEARRGLELDEALKVALAEAQHAVGALSTCQQEQTACCVARGPTIMPWIRAQGQENGTKFKKQQQQQQQQQQQVKVEAQEIGDAHPGHAYEFAGATIAPTSYSTDPKTCPSSVEPSSFPPSSGAATAMRLSNCLLHLHAGPGPCTNEALNQLTGCVGHVLTSSELVLKDVLRQSMNIVGKAQGFYDTVEASIDGAVAMAAGHVDGWMDVLARGLEVIDEEEKEVEVVETMAAAVFEVE